MGGKESSVGPGRFAPETKEVIHHHYNTIPSGEFYESDSESDGEDEGKKDSK
jgi:hypothetical protein